MKRSNTVHGTTPSSRRQAEWRRTNPAAAGSRSGNVQDSIVSMRQEIIESLQKSPTRLYDEEHSIRSQPASRGNTTRHAHSNSADISSNPGNLSKRGSGPEAKVLGSYYDDIFDVDADNGSHSRQHAEAEEEEEDDEDDDKLNIPFNNHNSISNSVSSTELMKSALKSTRDRATQNGNFRGQIPKRVLSRATSPEKPKPQPSRMLPAQHLRKKSKTSPPPPQSFSLQQEPLAHEIAKLKNTRKPPPNTLLNRPAQHAHPKPPLANRSTVNIDDERARTDLPPNNSREKRQSQMRTQNKGKPGTLIHDDVLDYDDEVEEIHAHESEGLRKKEEVSLIDSSVFLSSSIRFDPSELSKQQASYTTELASLKAQLAGKEIELSQMKASMQASEQKSFESDQTMVEKLELVAKELHVQYSRKHEAKVQALKKQHEAILASRVQEFETHMEELYQVIAQERREKDELVKTCDMYLEMDELRAREESQRTDAQSLARSHRGR